MNQFEITVTDPEGRETYRTHRMTTSDTTVIVRDELTSNPAPGTKITVEVR